MEEKQIDQLVGDFYSSHALSESKLQEILKNTPAKENVVPYYRREWFSYAAAACIALMIVSVVVMNVTKKTDFGAQTEIASSVINIYDNHYTPEVYSSDLDTIQTGLNHSGFSIVPTNLQTLKNYRVMGGRNCGLNGLKAVHVVLLNPDSQKEVCLYVLPDVEEFQKFSNALVDVDGSRVSLWHDNGRLFALYDPSL